MTNSEILAKQPRTVAVLRTFDSPDIVRVLQSLVPLEVDCVIVVVDATRDRIGTADLVRGASIGKPVELVELDGYGWARALNVALRLIVGRSQTQVLVLSNEVTLHRHELDALRRAAGRNLASCGYGRFRGYEYMTYRLPRNTCCLWNGRVFEAVGLFDESLDEAGGMEDYELALRAYVEHGWLAFMGAERLKLAARRNVNLAHKVAREAKAVALIESRYSPEVVRKFRRSLSAHALSAPWS